MKPRFEKVDFNDLPDEVKRALKRAVASESIKGDSHPNDLFHDKEIGPLANKLIDLVQSSDYPMILTSYNESNVLNMSAHKLLETVLELFVQTTDDEVFDVEDHDKVTLRAIEILSHHVPGELGKGLRTLIELSEYRNGEYYVNWGGRNDKN